MTDHGSKTNYSMKFSVFLNIFPPYLAKQYFYLECKEIPANTSNSIKVLEEEYFTQWGYPLQSSYASHGYDGI